MQWNNFDIAYYPWNTKLGLLGTNYCRAVVDQKKDEFEPEEESYKNHIWCYTGLNEPSLCAPKDAVECPKEGVVLT